MYAISHTFYCIYRIMMMMTIMTSSKQLAVSNITAATAPPPPPPPLFLLALCLFVSKVLSLFFVWLSLILSTPNQHVGGDACVCAHISL